MNNLSLEKKILFDCLKSAGKVQLEMFQKIKTYSSKGNMSNIVTDADIQSEKVILDTLQKKLNGHNILSEEYGYLDNASEFTWVIDPMDGTSNFAAGIPWFGILIALFKNNKPILAGAYLPMQELLYFAEDSKGSYLNDKKLFVTSQELSNTLFSFSTDFSENEEYLNNGILIYKYIVQHSRNIRSTNSLLDYLYVAEGRFGGAVNLFAKIWDIAAPYLIVKEAGGIFRNLDKSEIDFQINEAVVNLNFPVIVSAQKIYDQIKSIL